MEPEIPEIEVTDGEVVSHSPVIPAIPKIEKVGKVEEAEIVKEQKTMKFTDAIWEVTNGKKITRQGWEEKGCYGFLSESTSRLSLHKPDGDHGWILSKDDLEAKDWIIL